MQTYGVSDGTVMQELRDQGLIRPYQGRGSFKARVRPKLSLLGYLIGRLSQYPRCCLWRGAAVVA